MASSGNQTTSNRDRKPASAARGGRAASAARGRRPASAARGRRRAASGGPVDLPSEREGAGDGRLRLTGPSRRLNGKRVKVRALHT